MFKTTISYLIILSILLIDVASAMKPRSEEDKRPISRRLSGDFSSSASIETSPKGHKKSQSLGNVVRDETHLPLTDTLQKEKIPASLLQMEQPETSLTLKNEEISQEQKSSLSDQDDLTPPSSPSSGPTHEGERAPSPPSSDEDKNGESSPTITSEGTSPPRGSPSTSSSTGSLPSGESLQILEELKHSPTNSSSEMDEVVKENLQALRQTAQDNKKLTEEIPSSTKDDKLEENSSAFLPSQNTIEIIRNETDKETLTSGLLEEAQKIRAEINSICAELTKIKTQLFAEEIIAVILDLVGKTPIKKVTQSPLSDENTPLLRKESKEESLRSEQNFKSNLPNGNGALKENAVLKFLPYPRTFPPKESALVGKINGISFDENDMESGAHPSRLDNKDEKTNGQSQVGPKGSLNADDGFIIIESDQGSIAAYFPNDNKGNFIKRKFKVFFDCCGKTKQLKSEKEPILIFVNQKDLKEGDFKDLQNLPPLAKTQLKRTTKQEIEGELT